MSGELEAFVPDDFELVHHTLATNMYDRRMRPPFGM